MALGTITIEARSPLPSDTVTLDNLIFTDGFPALDQVAVVEEVTSAGVNNTRLRIVRYDFPTFTLTGMSGVNGVVSPPSTAWQNAVTGARRIRQLTGRIGTITFVAGGVTYTITNKFYLESVRATPQPGAMVSVDAGEKGAYIDCMFILKLNGG